MLGFDMLINPIYHCTIPQQQIFWMLTESAIWEGMKRSLNSRQLQGMKRRQPLRERLLNIELTVYDQMRCLPMLSMLRWDPISASQMDFPTAIH